MNARNPPPTDLSTAAQELRERDEAFAVATIVRTAGATAAKPGAKALLGADGAILEGWLGGGCTRGAVREAALLAMESGIPRLISVAPEDILKKKGVGAGEIVDGIHYARSGCPSRGSVDIFIEPRLPMPELIVAGASSVAKAVADLAPQFEWFVSTGSTEAEMGQRVAGRLRAIVVATQGNGDLAALNAALAVDADHIAFVGSVRKFAALSSNLKSSGLSNEAIARIKAPAGVNIGAVTPEEIALSILAELVQLRRMGMNRDAGSNA